ncbi:MAG: DUF2339 domain-containing protein [Candidatus Omnitrophica bacterium]|nr:DUF2339 domain-containing protein [Candidatus Omnitrophota bacterium]
MDKIIFIKGLNLLYQDARVIKIIQSITGLSYEETESLVKDNPQIKIKKTSEQVLDFIIDQLKELGLIVSTEKIGNVIYEISVNSEDCKELESIKEELNTINFRVKTLENKLKMGHIRSNIEPKNSEQKNDDSKQSLEETIILNTENLKEIEELADNPPKVKMEIKNIDYKDSYLEKPKKKEGLESRIGKFWMHKLGIIIFVLGMAFLVGNAVKEYLFNPIGRSVLGLAVSSGLIFFGKHLFKKDTYRNYSISVLGGGWGLLYFVVYAMHHIQSLKIIFNPVFDFILLSGIVVLIIIESLKYDSRGLISMAYILGFITMLLNTLSVFTLLSGLLLAVAILYLAYKKCWDGVCLLGVFGVYLSHLFWIYPKIHNSFMPLSSSMLSIHYLLLFVYWFIFSFGPYLFLPNQKMMKPTTYSINLINAFMFLPLIQMTALVYYPQWNWIIVTFIGVVYFLKDICIRELTKDKYHEGIDIILGLSLISYGIFLKFTGVSEILIFLVEGFVLTEVGIRLRNRKYRIFSFVIIIVTFLKFMFLFFESRTPVLLGLSKCFWVGIPFTTVLVLCGLRLRQNVNILAENEEKTVNIFYGLAYTVLILTVLWEFTGLTRIFVMTLVMFGLNELGLFKKKNNCRIFAMITSIILAIFLLYGFVSFRWKNNMGLEFSNNFLTYLIAISLFYINGLRLMNNAQYLTGDQRTVSFNFFTGIGIFFTFFIVPVEFPSQLYSLMWGIEGFVLLLLGFMVKNKKYRYAGLIFFMIVIIKLFLIDIAGLGITYKIISFLSLGIVLLIGSFFYSKYKAIIEGEDVNEGGE